MMRAIDSLFRDSYNYFAYEMCKLRPTTTIFPNPVPAADSGGGRGGDSEDDAREAAPPGERDMTSKNTG